MRDIRLTAAVILGNIWVQGEPDQVEGKLVARPGVWYTPAELGDEHDTDERLMAEAVYRYLREFI